MPDELKTALATVFDYLWQDEFKDFDNEEYPSENRIACALQVIGRVVGRL